MKRMDKQYSVSIVLFSLMSIVITVILLIESIKDYEYFPILIINVIPIILVYVVTMQEPNHLILKNVYSGNSKLILHIIHGFCIIIAIVDLVRFLETRYRVAAILYLIVTIVSYLMALIYGLRTPYNVIEKQSSEGESV